VAHADSGDVCNRVLLACWQMAEANPGLARPNAFRWHGDNHVSVRVAHTADLTANELAAARALVFAAFDDCTEDDWEDCLGGIHAMVWEGDAMVAHGAVVQRRLIYKNQPRRTGYVEGVAVRSDRRRQGFGAAVMSELERVIKAAYELGALGTTNDGFPFYMARGWRQWKGRTYALTPAGNIRTAKEDEAILVLEASSAIDVTAD
jgi:aminoglycoside 2'-N-acetyltransferase I